MLGIKMTPDEIREAVLDLQNPTVSGEEEAWNKIKHLKTDVVPYLLEAYPKFTRYQGRASLVCHSIRYARVSEEAYQLGLKAIEDRATLVRYRGCGLLAYSLRKDAIPNLKKLLKHSDKETANDAKAAIKAIKKQNHHLFRDRDNSGRVFWVVNKEDENA